MKHLVLLLLLVIAVPALAAPAHHRRTCASCGHDRAAPVVVVAPAKAATSSAFDALVSGLELDAGFRWQPEHACPTLVVPHPVPHVRDPFYLGATLRLPLAAHAGLFGSFDRDFTERAAWQARTGLYFAPFAH